METNDTTTALYAQEWKAYFWLKPWCRNLLDKNKCVIKKLRGNRKLSKRMHTGVVSPHKFLFLWRHLEMGSKWAVLKSSFQNNKSSSTINLTTLRTLWAVTWFKSQAFNNTSRDNQNSNSCKINIRTTNLAARRTQMLITSIDKLHNKNNQY